MNLTFSIIHIAAPLLLVTLGALISEYAGRMAMFLECMINLGAFCCFAFTMLTGNPILAVILSVTICTLLVIFFEVIASKCNANMFLVSLALNMLFAALATFFSAILFNTRGVLYSQQFIFNAHTTRIITTVLCYIFSLMQILMLHFTSTGLKIRITGSDADVLIAKGISASYYRRLSWFFAAANASFCGCVLALRLSSYVPGVSSGRGWTALAAVFLGRKNPLFVAFAVLVFAAAEYASSFIQNIQIFHNIPSSFLLALPYIVALTLIILIPNKLTK